MKTFLGEEGERIMYASRRSSCRLQTCSCCYCHLPTVGTCPFARWHRYDIKLVEPVARDLRAFSMFPQENELLLPPNFCFEIESIFPAGNGFTLVQCKQTETLDVLLDFGAPPSTWNVERARLPAGAACTCVLPS